MHIAALALGVAVYVLTCTDMFYTVKYFPWYDREHMGHCNGRGVFSATPWMVVAQWDAPIPCTAKSAAAF